MLKKLRYLLAFILAMYTPMFCNDVLVEFKAAYFLPSDAGLKNIYGNGGALYGPEVTFQLDECKKWYGFASIDFFSKKGHSVGLCTPTTMYMMPLAVGVKYFAEHCYGNFYAGLGFQPTRLKIVNCSDNATQTTTKWGFGGIVKFGSYFDLPCNYFIDLFIDYSFAKVGRDCCSTQATALKVNLNGAIFGVGLGYKFN